MFDFQQSPAGQDPIEVSATFAAKPPRLFKAWTDAKEIKQWFGLVPGSVIDARVDATEGGQWCFLLEDSAEKRVQLEGEYLTVEPNRELVFTWSHVVDFGDGRREATPHSKVSVLFTEVDQQTRIDLRHEAIQSESGRLGVGSGWRTCFEHLESHYCPTTPAL